VDEPESSYVGLATGDVIRRMLRLILGTCPTFNDFLRPALASPLPPQLTGCIRVLETSLVLKRTSGTANPAAK